MKSRWTNFGMKLYVVESYFIDHELLEVANGVTSQYQLYVGGGGGGGGEHMYSFFMLILVSKIFY